MLLQGKKPKNIKYGNQRAVFSVLRQNESVSVGDIAAAIHLSSTAVSKIINAFLHNGMIRCSGKGESTNEGGKRPELFSANPDYKYGMVLIAETVVIKCYIFDLFYNERCRVECPSMGMGYDEYLRNSADVIQQTMNRMGIGPDRLYGCCISAPGIIDSVNGAITFPVWKPSWGVNRAFCAELKALLPFDLDMIIENNSRISGYGEVNRMFSGRPEGSYVVICTSDEYMNVTPGVGGSIINNKKVRRGTNGYAGEFGHMTVDYDDEELCVCGRRGCLQTKTYPARVINYAHSRREAYPDSALWEIENKRKLELKDLFNAANAGDPLAMEVIDMAALYHARVIENIILTIDPAVIVISGGYMHGGEYFLNSLRSRIAHAGLFGSVNNLKICYSAHEPETYQPIGAAMFLFDGYFDKDETYFMQEVND